MNLAKGEAAHSLRAKWSRTKAVLSLSLILLVGAPLVSVAQPTATKAAALATSVGGVASASAKAGLARRAQQPTTQAGAPRPQQQQQQQQQRQQTQQQVQLHQQGQIEALLAQLAALEGRPAESLAECANWYQTSLRYAQLSGATERRPEEERKKEECDGLQRFYAETRSKLANLRRLLHEQPDQLELVSALLNELLDLKYAASISAPLASEFRALRESDERVDLGVERLEQFMQFMGNVLGARTQQSEGALLVAAPADSEDELAELDSTLKLLIDREASLGPDELAQLAELSSMLDSILVGGHVDLASGRFRYLSGTLDAARAVLLRWAPPADLRAAGMPGRAGVAPLGQSASAEEELGGTGRATLQRPTSTQRTRLSAG